MSKKHSPTPFKKIVSRAVLAVLALVTLQACSACSSNYSPDATGDGRPVEGLAPEGTYYQLVPGFTCASQSHVYSKIDVTRDAVHLTTYSSSDCSSTTTSLLPSGLDYSSLSPALIGYKNSIFQAEVQEPNSSHPQVALPETWCRSEVKNNALIDISVAQDPISLNYVATITGAFLVNGSWQISPSEQQVVSRGALAQQLTYTSPTLTLNANRTVVSPAAGGVFSGTYAGQNLSFNSMQCRFGQTFDSVVANKPSLAFDLLAGALPSIMNFSRAGAGTYFDSSGFIRTAASQVPRFDHDPSTFAPLGLLVEEARTNQLLSAVDLTGAGWTNSGIGVYASGQIAGLNSFEIIKDNPSDLEYWRRSLQSVNVTSGTMYTVSFFAQRGNVNTALLTMWQDSTNNLDVTFDLNAGTASIQYQSGVTFVSDTIVPVGSAYRISVTFIPSTTLMDVGIGPSTTNLNDYIIATGGQLEVGAGPTSLILTSSTALTRGEDVAQISNMSWYTGSQGTFQIDVSRPGPEASGGNALPQAMALTNASSDSQSLYYDVANAVYHAHLSVSGSTSDWDSASSLRTGLSAIQDLLFTYISGNAALQLNGSVVHDPSATSVGLAPTLLQIGGPSSAKWNAHFRSLSFWPNNFDDPTLQTLAH